MILLLLLNFFVLSIIMHMIPMHPKDDWFCFPSHLDDLFLCFLLYFLMCPGQGSGDGKKALYHCNYCNKDITGKTRIKCAMCPDFDLCLECFSVGAEVTPHKSNHPYRVMVSASPSNNLLTCYFACFCSLSPFNPCISMGTFLVCLMKLWKIV